MTLIYIIVGLIGAALLTTFLKTKKETNSQYFKIKRKLDEDLLQASFSGDWKKRQEINLYLLWLKTINEIESRDMFGRKKEETLLLELSLDDIKFPLHWKLDDFYCYPFSQEIISAYGKILAENDYKGMFKPDSILPVPKNHIRKAILFTFDYFNLKEPIYDVPNKDERAKNLNTINLLLDMSFVDTGNNDLPKSGIENHRIGNAFKKEQLHSQLDELKLIDWRTELDWIVKGVHYTDKEQYDYAFECYEQVRKINPDNKDLKPILSLTYLHIGEQYYEKGDKKLAFENIRKAAELENEKAIIWLEQHQAN